MRTLQALAPKLSGDGEGLYTLLAPPALFASDAVDFIMVLKAERNGKLVTDLEGDASPKVR